MNQGESQNVEYKRRRKRPRDCVDYPDYPERAVTEALVNALVHREYTIYGSDVHVDISPDRLEIISPGGMPDGSAVSTVSSPCSGHDEDEISATANTVKKLKE